MKYLAAILTFLLLSTNLFASESIELYSNKLSLMLPENFSEMPIEVARIKYPMELHRPKHIYSNEMATTSIAINLLENAKLKQSEIVEFRNHMAANLPRIIPGLVWIRQDVIEINNKIWGRLELMSNAIDTEIHNIMLMTSFEGKPLMINFNSTKEEFDSVKTKLETSISSIRIKE